MNRHIHTLRRWIAHRCGETPVETIIHLDDDPNRIYVWQLVPGTDTATVAHLQQSLAHTQELHGLQATHMIVTDLQELRAISKKELRDYIQPLLEVD